MPDPATQFPPLSRQIAWWTLAFPIVMIVAVAQHDVYLLNWIHVLSGTLWTGTDLFMGFVLRPALRGLDVRSRNAVITYLVPRTLLYFPTISLTAGASGWILADWLGFTASTYSRFNLVVTALVMVAVMTIFAMGFLLPNNLRIWFELRRPAPDPGKVIRLNRINVRLAGIQGILQVAIILVMSGLVT